MHLYDIFINYSLMKNGHIEAVSWPFGDGRIAAYRGRIEAISLPYRGRVEAV